MKQGNNICERCNGQGSYEGKVGGSEGVPESDVLLVCNECGGTGKTSPSIPVNDATESNLEKLANLLESRGIRRYLNINNSGYSQVERDIVELFQPPAQPIPVNDEIHAADIEDGINKDFGLCKKIAESYNHTYGKGYDPTAMEELYTLLDDISNWGKSKDGKFSYTNTDPAFLNKLQTALHNSKTTKK